MARASQDYRPSSQPTSIISLENSGDTRKLKFVGVKSDDSNDSRWNHEERYSFIHLLRILSKTNLMVASLLFTAVAITAACLCRPVAILGGLLVSMLFLGQGILGHHVIKLATQSLLIGYSCLSGFVSVISLASALYLFSGQFVLACTSPLHIHNQPSVTRLYIVELTTLVATVPLLTGSVACLISAVLSSTETRKPKKIFEPQLFLYLQDSNKQDGLQKIPNGRNDSLGMCPSAPEVNRSGTPPPAYQRNEESFA